MSRGMQAGGCDPIACLRAVGPDVSREGVG